MTKQAYDTIPPQPDQTPTQANHRAELEVWLRDVICP